MSQQLELAVARGRIRQLKIELAVARKVNEVLLAEGSPQKALPGDRVSGRAGNQRAAGMYRARGLAVGLPRLEGPSGCTQDAPPDLAGG